ncbi:MAG: SDR family oxidoreductase [Saprospiraceae bacterium]
MNALITGSSKGIGLAIARKFASEGINLILCSRNIIELESVRSELLEINSNIEVLCFASDLSTANGVKTLADFVKSNGSSLNILVNNAGVYLSGNITQENDGLLEKMMNTNLYSAYYLTIDLLDLIKSSSPSYIFNMCSIAGINTYPNGSLYCISKFAMNGFSKCLREELKKDKVKVCTIYPGATWSDSWKGAEIPISRIMEANDIAEAISCCLKMSSSAVVEEIVMRPQLGDL